MRAIRPEQPNANCPYCRAENYPFASFCISCGEPLDDPPGAGAEHAAISLAPQTPLTLADTSPQHTSRSALLRREAVLGLLLLVVTLGYALYDWHWREEQSAAYRDGVAAERKKDWERAADAFEKAAGHLDASEKAQYAEGQLTERNRLYGESLAAEERDDWNGAILALERLQGVQPAFADSASRLAQARERSFMARLSGIAYSVREGPAEGLYLLDSAGKPVLLPGSDSSSAVRAVSPGGAGFVYDRSKFYTEYPATGPAGRGPSVEALSNAALRRVPVIAYLEGSTLRTTPLPGINGEGYGVFSRSGLWWRVPTSGRFSREEVYYIAENEERPRPIRVTGRTGNRRVLATDPERDRLIIAERTESFNSSYGEIRISVAGPDGGSPRHVRSVTSEVEQAAVSPDGARLLLVLKNADQATIERSVWEVLLDGSGARRIATQEWAPDLDPEAPTEPYLDAHFIQPPGEQVHVVVDRIDGTGEELMVYNVERNSIVYEWQGKRDDSREWDNERYSNGGQYLVMRRHNRAGVMLEMVDLTGRNAVRWWQRTFRTRQDQDVEVSFAPRDNYLVIGLHDTTQRSEPGTQRIYTVKMSRETGLGNPRPVADAFRPPASDLADAGTLPQIAAAPDLLAYVSPEGELHARYYDGKSDTTVAAGVQAVWSLHAMAAQPRR